MTIKPLLGMKKRQYKNYKERADYLSMINPQNAQIYRAIASFFGEEEIPPMNKKMKSLAAPQPLDR